MTDVSDVSERWETLGSEGRFSGRVVSVRTDKVRMGDDVAERDVVVHPGSVGVLALDEDDRVLLIRQYRHPVEHLLWEPPAGLRDVPGEPLWRTAARELAEEASYAATEWHTLVDLFSSPGMTTERIRIFLARGITEHHIDFERVHEEADMPAVWIPLDEAVTRVLRGDIHNPLAIMGIMATYAARANGYHDLRPADTPEP